jgi:hypothetical protein
MLGFRDVIAMCGIDFAIGVTDKESSKAENTLLEIS